MSEKYNEYKPSISPEEKDYICSVVRTHMGPWSDIKPENRHQLIVYYADYIASRKEISISFLEESISSDDITNIPYELPKMTVDSYVFDFGKTKGMTIAESYKANPGYLKWMANKEGFGNVEVQNLVKEYIKTV